MNAPATWVLNKAVSLRQPEKGFRTSLDSVMLAAACPLKSGQSVLDLGCGVGGAGLCALYRVEHTRLTGIDIQEDYIGLAVKNAADNGVTERAAFVCGDVRNYRTEEMFDAVICNPPYLEAGAHTRSPVEAKAIANGQEELDLKDWIDAGFRNLKSKGSLTVIHRADTLDKIIQALGRRFGGTEIIPLWPRGGEPAKRVIIRTYKDRRSPAVLHPGIVLHEPDGNYTEYTERILRDGQSI